jgi:hypothetical protein
VTLDQIGSHQYFVKQRVEDIDKRIQYMEVRGWEGERGREGEGEIDRPTDRPTDQQTDTEYRDRERERGGGGGREGGQGGAGWAGGGRAEGGREGESDACPMQ